MYDWTDIFTDIGKLVDVGNTPQSLTAALETLRAEVNALFNDDADDIDFGARVIDSIEGIQSRLDSATSSIVARIQLAFESILKAKYQSTYIAYDDGLVDMIAKMVNEVQSVDGNEVSMLPGYLEIDDTWGQLSGYDGIRRMNSGAIDEQGYMYFVVEPEVDYSSDFVVRVYNNAQLRSQDRVAVSSTFTAPGTVTLTPVGSSGLAGTLTITANPVEATIRVLWTFDGVRAGTGELQAWAASQMAVNDDILLVCINASTAGSEQWRVQSRIRGTFSGNSGIAITGTAFPGDNQDFAGVSLTVGAVAGRIFGDDNALLSLPGNITGGEKDENSDSAGKIYAAVIDEGGGDYRIDFYKDLGLTQQVAHTATYTAIGLQTILPDNSSGLGGTIRVDKLGSDASIEILLEIDYAVGDEFLFRTYSDDDGTFQSFFRDYFYRTFPFALDGSETIPDTLAE